MNVSRTLATAALLLLPLLAFAPTGAAFTPAVGISGVFIQSGSDGPSLSFGSVAQGDSQEIPLQTAAPAAAGAPPICVRVFMSNAGECVGAVLGVAASPTTFSINGTGGFQLWLSTNAPAPVVLESVAATLLHVDATGKTTEVYRFQSHRTSQPPEADLAPRSDAGGDPATSTTFTLTDTPTRVAMGDERFSTIRVFADQTLQLLVEVITPVSGPEDLRIVAHYGPDMPSGVLFELHGQTPSNIRMGTTTLPIYATGTNVTFHPIDNDTQQVLVFPTGSPAPPSTVVQGSTLTFGPTPLDESTRLVGDGFIEFTVATASAAAGPNLGFAFDVVLTIGEKTFTAVTNLATHAATSDGVRYAAPLRVMPGDILAGENVTLSITLYSPKADNVALVFGSTDRPFGVHLPAMGGGRVGPPPPPAASAAPVEPPAETEEPASSEEPEPEPSAEPTPSPSEQAAPTSTAATEDAGALKTVPPRNTPGAGIALLTTALACLAVALRAGRGKGS